MDASVAELQYHGNVCISGLTASGKTTHSHLLAGELGLTYVSGSQIQLNLMGVSPIQPKDFWISETARRFWDPREFERIDAELLNLERTADGFVYDTSTMPWRHKRPALCIWLESSLDSRVLKSIVSHRGRGTYPICDYPQRLTEKDNATVRLYKTLYNINIGTDLSCFDLILDIGPLIAAPTLEASLRSIALAHSVIRPAVAWYLTRRPEFRRQFEMSCDTQRDIVLRNRVLESDTPSVSRSD